MIQIKKSLTPSWNFTHSEYNLPYDDLLKTREAIVIDVFDEDFIGEGKKKK
jgi:hypothetical protein